MSIRSLLCGKTRVAGLTGRLTAPARQDARAALGGSPIQESGRGPDAVGGDCQQSIWYIQETRLVHTLTGQFPGVDRCHSAEGKP
jgi:hypothetical protein